MNSAENTISNQGCGRSEPEESVNLMSGAVCRVSETCPVSGSAWVAPEAGCSGCGVCAALCPRDAIAMVRREKDGFLYPKIDGKECVGCGKCGEICPAAHKKEDGSPFYSQVFAAINRDFEARFRAASGAMFEALAKSMLENGGAVAGVVYTDNLRGAKHVLIEDTFQLPALCGTKYFQSDMGEIYQETRDRIKRKGKKVLFCGTPCQVRGMKAFAEDEGISDNLFTVDLLCRGVPSPLAWEKYLEYLEGRHKKKIKGIKVKDKERGWDRVGVMITFEDESKAYEQGLESVFERSFIQTNLAIRESCLSCPYKSIRREGDITVGDFWGLRNTSLLKGNMGTSLLAVNSPKGLELFYWAKDKLTFRPSTMWRVWKGNLPAFTPVFCHENKRKNFWQFLGDGMNLDQAVNLAMGLDRSNQDRGVSEDK